MSKLPLTKRFYVLDEVQAALLYTSSRGHIKESGFWCRELIESGYIGEAISILFESWLWHRGPFHLSWFIEAFTRLSSTEVSADDILCMVYQLSSFPIKDHSLWTMYAWSIVDPDSLFDRITSQSPSSFPSEDPTEIFFICAVFQHKAQSAWRISLTIDPARLWTLIEWYVTNLVPLPFKNLYEQLFCIIKQYDQLLGYSSPEYDRAIMGLVLLSICLTVSQQETSFKTTTSTPSIPSLSLTNHREYSIPHYGLYGITQRGCLSQKMTTFDHLYDVESAIQDCPYWEEAKEPYQDSKEKWLSHDTRESFYNRYFPNDIPDEWALKEKEKSHGHGILQQEESVTVWGFMRRYMMGQTRLAWGRGHLFLRKSEHVTLLDKVGIEGVSPFLALLSLLPTSIPPIALDKLKPVYKKKIIR